MPVKQYYCCRFCSGKISAGSLSSKPAMVTHILKRHPDIEDKYMNMPIDETLKMCFELRGEKE